MGWAHPTLTLTGAALLDLTNIHSQISQVSNSDRPSAGIWEGPYLVAGPCLACHMLDHNGEQALTEHLGRERQGNEMGDWAEQGP